MGSRTLSRLAAASGWINAPHALATRSMVEKSSEDTRSASGQSANRIFSTGNAADAA